VKLRTIMGLLAFKQRNKNKIENSVR